jgi:hypothetical protein
MVRAELGNSNRDHAVSLIKRVQERYVSHPYHYGRCLFTNY